MFNKALWIKEWKQNGLLWLMPILAFFGVTSTRLSYVMDSENSKLMNLKMFQEQGADSFYLATNNTYGTIIMLVVFLCWLGVNQIGAERKNLMNDFTFSLPYKRWEIYLNKFTVGFVTLAASLVIATIIDMAIVLFSPFGMFFSPSIHIYEAVVCLSILTAFYSSLLLVGTMTGGSSMQLLLTIIFNLFPVLFAGLVLYFVEVNFGAENFLPNMDFGNMFMMLYSTPFLMYLGHIYPEFSVIPVILYSVVCLGLGTFLYNRSKLENNGKMLLFAKLETIFHFGVTICFALLGGMFAVVVSEETILHYYIGFIIFGLLAFFGFNYIKKVRFKG
ncbi:ABC transporter permease subunit [Brevibacillus daliensis]|uniref:ABC transporter permease subunit n=1 Tax=Brevibacillus daliensis TaxID=2892995 RepID=UPI001E3AECE0|nr:ABC transporter permease subunit [Brevibacillus daliensis]